MKNAQCGLNIMVFNLFSAPLVRLRKALTN